MAYMKGGKLTGKQKKFVDYYIETLNASKSYKMAGYEVKNDNVAGVMAHRLLKNDNVKKAIEGRMEAMDNERIASADEVLERITNIIRGEVGEEFKDDYNLNHVMKALELMGKRHALFTEKVSVEGSVDVEINLGFDMDEVVGE